MAFQAVVMELPRPLTGMFYNPSFHLFRDGCCSSMHNTMRMLTSQPLHHRNHTVVSEADFSGLLSGDEDETSFDIEFA
jgi:hypothetical protein